MLLPTLGIHALAGRRAEALGFSPTWRTWFCARWDEDIAFVDGRERPW